MTPDFPDISTEEAYGKTVSSLDNNAYLDRESVYGAVYAVVEFTKRLGCTEEQARAHVEQAISKLYAKESNA